MASSEQMSESEEPKDDTIEAQEPDDADSGGDDAAEALQKLRQAKKHEVDARKKAEKEARNLKLRIKALESGEDPAITQQVEERIAELEEDHREEVSRLSKDHEKKVGALQAKLEEMVATETLRTTRERLRKELKGIETEDGPKWETAQAMEDQVELLLHRASLKGDKILINSGDDKPKPLDEVVKELPKTAAHAFVKPSGAQLGNVGERQTDKDRSNLELVRSGLHKLGVS